MVQLTRELRFSLTAGDEPAAPVDNTWVGAPATIGLAPYLCLRATLAGTPNSCTGYLCDIKIIDEELRRRAIPLARHLQLQARSCVWPEVLLLALWRRLPREFVPGATLARLELAPTPWTYFHLCREKPDMIFYTEQFEFSAAHRLHCPELSDDQNRELFGKCNNPAGHGHNYIVQVTIASGREPESEMLAARRRLPLVLKDRVLDRFDHKHLNEDTAEFRSLNPTVENIARVVWDLLVDQVAPARLVNVRVYETPKTWADVGEG